ncbi:MAG: YceI family protein [Bdellovibrionota bacterium]
MKFQLPVLLTVFLFLSSAIAQTSAVVDVTLNPMGSFKAQTSSVKGYVTQIPGGFKGENITVNLKDLKTGVGLRDEHLKDKYLEVSKYPEAVLTLGEGKAGKGTGTIKVHGVEQPISGTYEVKGKFLTAHFPLKISDFKIKEVNYKGIGAEDEVQVHVTVPIQAGAAASAAGTKPVPKKK